MTLDPQDSIARTVVPEPEATDAPTVLATIFSGDAGTLLTVTVIDPDGHTILKAVPLTDEELHQFSVWLTTLEAA